MKSQKSFSHRGSRMLSIVVCFLLVDFASSNIQFLTPTSGQEFASNETVKIKWKKVAGASNYSVKVNSSDGGFLETFKLPTKCNPRVWIGPLREGCWNVLVEARNQNGDIIDGGTIDFRVCQSLPCPNGTETNADCPACHVTRYFVAPGYIHPATLDYQFVFANLSECLDLCTNNFHPGVGYAPCKAFDFQEEPGVGCIMHRTFSYLQTIANPLGMVAPDSPFIYTYYEKVCIKAALADRCPGPYFFQPEMSMIVYDSLRDIVLATNASDCLQQCMDRHDFVCRSAVISDTTIKGNNCYLFTESRLTKPEAYQTVHPGLPGAPSGFSAFYLEPGCA